MHGTNQEIKECIDLRACAYTNWYKKFRKLTFDSVCIPLSDVMVKYLLDEIIILPKECYKDDDNSTFQSASTSAVDDEDDDPDDVVVSDLFFFTNSYANHLKKIYRSAYYARHFSNQNFLSSVNHWPKRSHDWAALCL